MDDPPPPPRLQRHNAAALHMNANDIYESLRRSQVSEASVRSVLRDFRALSPSQQTHIANRLMTEFNVTRETNLLLNGRMKKSRRRKRRGRRTLKY